MGIKKRKKNEKGIGCKKGGMLCPVYKYLWFIYVYLLTYLYRVRDSNEEYFHVLYHTLVILLRGQSS